MDYASAKTKYVRVPPRKARLAAQLIRGLSVPQAIEQLAFGQMKGARLLAKTLESAVANAETQHDLRRENLVVQEVLVDEGPRLKRAKPKNKGGKHPIIKRTSHFTVRVCAIGGNE